MNYIVVDDEQAKTITESQGSVEIRDRQGRHLARAVKTGFTETDAEQAERDLASDQPRYTFQQVLEHLHSLESK